MGYKDENIKHRVGFTETKKGFICPKCGGDKIKTKATFVACPSCKKVIEGKDLK